MVKALINISSIIGLAIALFISFSSFATAHPGNTASDGMHYCYTNCSSWGEVYGQRHGHGGSSYTPYSYTTPTYVSTFVSSNSDCTSNGFAYLGSCYELPDHAKKSYFSGFTCDYGYEEVGYGLSKKCLAEVDNGYRIGVSIFCDYGYKLYGSSCLSKSSGGYSYSSLASDYDSSYTCPKNSSKSKDGSGMCTCKIGYEVNADKDACKKTSKKTNAKICKAESGNFSVWTGKYDKKTETPTCQCKVGYEWNKKGTSCIKSL